MLIPYVLCIKLIHATFPGLQVHCLDNINGYKDLNFFKPTKTIKSRPVFIKLIYWTVVPSEPRDFC